MTANSYTVDVDAARNLVRYRIEGFWDAATVEAFVAELERGIARAKARPRVLGDASAFPVQTAEVAAAFEQAMLTRILPRIDRLALVVAKMLNKLQVDRGKGESATAVFLSEAEAMAWLDTH